jgi:hypothetical protein
MRDVPGIHRPLPATLLRACELITSALRTDAVSDSTRTSTVRRIRSASEPGRGE